MSDLTPDPITWFYPRPSYDPEKRTLSPTELDTLTAAEVVVDALTNTDIASWLCDLIAERDALETTLHAAMDALNECHHDCHRLDERWQDYYQRWQGCQQRLKLAMKIEPEP